MIKVSDWAKSFEKLPVTGISNTRLVDGACNIVTGGRHLVAQVELEFSPSTELIFSDNLPIENKELFLKEEWLPAICFGVLDTMLVFPTTPITCFKCLVKQAKFHPVFSTWQAFRLAARQATIKYLEDEPFVVLSQ